MIEQLLPVLIHEGMIVQLLPVLNHEAVIVQLLPLLICEGVLVQLLPVLIHEGVGLQLEYETLGQRADRGQQPGCTQHQPEGYCYTAAVLHCCSAAVV